MCTVVRVLAGIYCPPFASLPNLTESLNTVILSVKNFRIKIIIFSDGNKFVKENIENLTGYEIVHHDICKGKAFCFNYLIRHEGPDFFCFLEAGILLGPNCLSLLVENLKNDIHHGIGGPSVNRSWNEQSKSSIKNHTDNYRQTSEIFHKNFKSNFEELKPLYSLSDCCYLVKKGVIDVIGFADEAYGTGSCWEMDYNVRAARSGFKGIWVKDAYAERTLEWPAEDLQISRKIYQNRFCHLQKKENNGNYKLHCRGDECSNFAVSSILKIKTELLQQRITIPEKEFSEIIPMVSCIMPTAKRAHFVQKAIDFFGRQNYPEKELIIVYNENSDLPDNLLVPDCVKLIKTNAVSIGEKRNKGCENSHGSIIAQWDDDDIYSPNRISAQISPLLKGDCEITGLNNFSFYEESKKLYWRCSKKLFERLFIENVAGGTLVFLKSIWENFSVYPAISLREDCGFLEAVIKKGARLQRIDGKDLFIYFRHSYNSWHFNVGDYLNADEWERLDFSNNFKPLVPPEFAIVG
ncbi:MAG: glycosyltransferase family A protein [Ginsengibacter sp.]